MKPYGWQSLYPITARTAIQAAAEKAAAYVRRKPTLKWLKAKYRLACLMPRSMPMAVIDEFADCRMMNVIT
jgi:hypothetical protein